MIVNDGGGKYRGTRRGRAINRARQRALASKKTRKKKWFTEQDEKKYWAKKRRRSKKKWFTEQDEKRWWINKRRRDAIRASQTTTSQPGSSKKTSSVSRGASRTGKTTTRSPYTPPKVQPTKPRSTVAKKTTYKAPLKRKTANPTGLALEHYLFQNTFNFATDATGTSLDNVLREIRYEGPVREEDGEYSDYIEEKTAPSTLDLGLTAAEFEALFDASSVEKYAPDGTVYYDVNMDLPNTQGFRQIQVRITEIN